MKSITERKLSEKQKRQRIGRRILAWRTENNKTQEDLAAILGCSRALIGHNEVGISKPNLDVMEKLVAIMNLNSISDLWA